MIFDLARHWQCNFQDPASPLMEGLIDLHHNILFVLIIIFGVVTSLIIAILKDTSFIWIKPNKARILRQKQYLLFSNINHGTTLEIVWTLIPSFILFAIAIPSFSLLYSMEEILDPQITVKIVANQWYWSFEYGNLNLEWDSYLQNANLRKGQPRLLTVDNPLFLPVETNIRLLIASRDVIHAFAVPSLGLKVDAVPGRLNQLSCYINRPGIFYGQCSELCGVNHAFMPIEIVAILMGFPGLFLKAFTCESLIKKYLLIYSRNPVWVKDLTRRQGIIVVSRYDDLVSCINHHHNYKALIGATPAPHLDIWLILYFDYKHKHLILSCIPEIKTTTREHSLKKLDNKFNEIIPDSLKSHFIKLC